MNQGGRVVRRFVLLILATLPGLAASSTPTRDPALTIQGVGLGAAPAAVRKSLGKPLTQVVHADDSDMGMGRLMDLSYSGLTFEFCEPPGATDFHVWRVTVKSPTYVVEPGLKVGMPRDAVLRLLGPPASSEVDPTTGIETLH